MPPIPAKPPALASAASPRGKAKTVPTTKQATAKESSAGWRAKSGGDSARPIPPRTPGVVASRPGGGGEVGASSPLPISQHGNTFVGGGQKTDGAARSRSEAMKVWSAVYNQLRPTDVAPGSPVYGGTLDGGKSKFEVSKKGDEHVLRLVATGAAGVADATLRASSGGEAKSELWITFVPTAAPKLQQLEIVTKNGEPPTFTIGGNNVERGAVLDYVEAYGSLGVGDAPNTRAILRAMLTIPAASPLIYQGSTEIVRSLLLGN